MGNERGGRTGDERPSADSSAPESELTPQYTVSFSAERTARYHMARRGFFEKMHRGSMFIIVAIGTTGVAGALVSQGINGAFLSGLSALLGAANLVFDPAGRARQHEALQRKAFELCAEIDSDIAPSAERCAEWTARLHKIYADEPPPMLAVDAVAYNATLAGRREQPDLLVITPLQSWLRNFWSFANVHFPHRSELKAEKT